MSGDEHTQKHPKSQTPKVSPFSRSQALGELESQRDAGAAEVGRGSQLGSAMLKGGSRWIPQEGKGFLQCFVAQSLEST